MTQPVGNAYDMMVATLRDWGLESLAPNVLGMLQNGTAQDQIPVLLQSTDAYRKRFAGNEARRKANLAVLSPGEYLAVEKSYRQVMESNGLPKGFYDSPGDYAEWIGNDVSPQEIQTRVGHAVDAANQVDDGTKRAFRDYYGVGANDLAAFFLDQTRALPHIENIAKAARIGAAGFDQGVDFNRTEAERLATSTMVGSSQIEQAVGAVAEQGRDVGRLGQIYGDRSYGAGTAADEVFFGDTEAKRRKQALVDRERAEFSGGSGVGKSSLAQDSGLY